MIRIQPEDFDLAEEYQQLRQGGAGVGAIVTFTGLVRDFNNIAERQGASVETLFLEHYPGMTERLLEDIIREARDRWQLSGVTVIHRIGELKPGDQIVFVGTAAAHRAEAFAAAEFLMDYLKTRAAFWKRVRRGGRNEWLDMKDSDRMAASRWQREGKQPGRDGGGQQ